MENDQSNLDHDHVEDDLSYMYDLDGDQYSHAPGGYTANNLRRSIYTDEEEGR